MGSELIDIGPEARAIIARLSKVELSAAGLDAERAERAIAEFFGRLGLPERPFRRARDFEEANECVMGRWLLDLFREASEARAEPAHGPDMVARSTPAMNAAFSAAFEAVRGEVFDRVRVTAVEHLYGPSNIPDYDSYRQRRRMINDAWRCARNALRDVAWAAGELACVHEAGDSRAFAELKLPLLDALEAGVWLYWLTKWEVIVLPRPSISLREGRLHGDGRPAVVWETGRCLHFLNGVTVPERVALTPARELDCRTIFEERNADVRRELVRKIGIERVVTELGAVCVDRGGDYELLVLDIGDGRRRPFLKMRNPSVGVWHVEGVHPDCTTVAEALNWRNGTDVPPTLLT